MNGMTSAITAVDREARARVVAEGIHSSAMEVPSSLQRSRGTQASSLTDALMSTSWLRRHAHATG